MATFIKLSRKNGGSLSVNVDQLASFEEAYSSNKEFCILRMCGDSIFVDETHDYIESLINKESRRTEYTCEGCVIPNRDYGHAPSPCNFCARNDEDRYDLYTPAKVAE